MRRLLVATAAASMFLLSSRAGAQDMPAAITVKAKLKLDGSTGSAQTFLYVTGDAPIYPDGTSICVGIQAPGRADYIRPVARCQVSKGQFLAEIGPWDKHFPAGRYHVVAEFRFEDQTPAMQKALGGSRDMERCVGTDGDFLQDHMKVNAPRAQALLDYFKRTGRCPGKTATGDAWLQVGTDDEADRARITEDKDLREHAEAARRLALAVAGFGTDGSVPATALSEWRDEYSELEATVRKYGTSDICCHHPEAWQNLQNAFMSLASCADDVQSLATGEGARLAGEVRELEAKVGADKDDSRRLAKDRAGLAALRESRLKHGTAAAEALAAALYGPSGLEPAPERARAFEHDLVSTFGDNAAH